MSTITLSEVQSQLPKIIADLSPSDELVIEENGLPVAKLAKLEPRRWPCKAGSARHLPIWIAPDFDAPLEEFREYME